MKLIFRVNLLVLVGTFSSFAQRTRLTGKVTDATGAVLTGADVNVKDVGAAAFTTKTNGEGAWQISSLTAGDYVVTVSSAAFSTVQTTHFRHCSRYWLDLQRRERATALHRIGLAMAAVGGSFFLFAAHRDKEWPFQPV